MGVIDVPYMDSDSEAISVLLEMYERMGDCLALQLDQPVAFHNPTRKPARYAVVLGTPGALA
jgi:hypothetical protein